VVDVSGEGKVEVAFTGACRCCPLQPVTMGTAVLPAFEGVAGVNGVHCKSVRVSRFAMERMGKLMGPTFTKPTR
jgi:Fe-S cluster biogenesis protein NfuA